MSEDCANEALLFLDNGSKYSCHAIPDLKSTVRSILLLWSRTWIHVLAVLTFDCTYRGLKPRLPFTSPGLTL